MAWVASAVSGVFSEGFHTTLSPQTKRERRVPRPHRDGEVEGGDDAADAERMPGLHHAVVGALGGDGQAVELAREADREVADVDHLLHLAEALGDDLAGLERDEAAEIVLGGAQLLAEQAHELAAPGRRDLAPGLEGGVGPADGGLGLVGRRLAHMGDHLAGDRRAGRTAAGGEGALRHAEAREDGAGLVRNGGGCGGYGFQARGHVGLPECGRRAHGARHPRLSLKRNDGGFHATVLKHDRDRDGNCFSRIGSCDFGNESRGGSDRQATASRRMFLTAGSWPSSRRSPA